MPTLTPPQELAILARGLWRRGYRDHIAGHITVNRGDETLWCNPRLLRWDEIRPEHAIVINLDGDVLEGDWPAPAGIPLHLALRRARPDIGVVVHGHPLYSTVWAGIGEVPPAMDQTSATGSGDPVLVAQYAGTVNDDSAAETTAARMGNAELALLAGHGVVVTAPTVAAAYRRAVALELRCKRAWHALVVADGPIRSPLPGAFLEWCRQGGFGVPPGYWEAAVRAELRAEPSLLDLDELDTSLAT